MTLLRNRGTQGNRRGTRRARAREAQRGQRERGLKSEDILKIAHNEGNGDRPESGLKDLLQRSSIEKSPGGTQRSGDLVS